jgi:hypothetical protein
MVCTDSSNQYVLTGWFVTLLTGSTDCNATDTRYERIAELKGVNSFFNVARDVGLLVPLMALVDYRGFRIIGSSQLPITKDTLLYGSRDGGFSIQCKDANVVAKVKHVANALNVGSHRVIPLSVVGAYAKKHQLAKSGIRALLEAPPPDLVDQYAVEMHGPVDMEVHRGHDGNHYVLDLARLFPCQPQPVSGYAA